MCDSIILKEIFPRPLDKRVWTVCLKKKSKIKQNKFKNYFEKYKEINHH